MMKNPLTTTNARRAAAAAAIAIGVGMSFGAPASADEPVTYPGSFSDVDVNPCTDKEITLNINLDFRDHVGHENNFVGHASRTGWTSDGYVMDHGIGNFQVNGNVLHEAFKDTWRHPDGSAFRGVFTRVVDMRTGEVKVMRFDARCLGS
jgi:hypothetical protein